MVIGRMRRIRGTRSASGAHAQQFRADRGHARSRGRGGLYRMWVTGDVELPQAVLDAQAAGLLVFFVGAGASVDAPSDLPSFKGLARELAAQARWTFDESRGDLDTYLGEMPATFDTHAHARDLIARADSRPNETHRLLVRVGASIGPLRIVTTNFDDHLATAALGEGIGVPDKWFGPALPMGDDFAGIVHLHGSVLREPRELVITDTDFGKAYLTKAWATRFLLPMFQEHTVVFVGYSHDDPIMKYLALGLPARTQRYAFTLADQAVLPKWDRLHVNPISYPGSDADHTALVAALQAWDARVRMGRLDHQARMTSILEGGSALAPVEHDYLAGRLATTEGARQFAESTATLGRDRLVDWLLWVETLAQFRAAFGGVDGDESTAVLIAWFCERFVASPELNGAALQTAQRLGQVFSRGLVRGTTWATHQLSKSDEVAGTRWKALLASSVHGYSAPGDLDQIFDPFRAEPRENIAVLRAGLRPFIALKQRWFLSEVDSRTAAPDADLRWHVDEDTLTSQLHRLVESAAPGDAGVGALLEDALGGAYDLLDAYRGTRDRDGLSHRRSAIEPHEQDRFREASDAIIDALRDYGEKALGALPALAERWWSLGRGIFRRLAVHLIGTDGSRTADEKVAWLMDRALLYEYGLKHEVYRVLKASAGSATAPVRAKLLAAAVAGPALPADTPDLDHHRAYSIFNLLVWLSSAAPEWTEAHRALETAHSANPTFAAREYPDFDSWMSVDDGIQPLAVTPEDFIRGFQADPDAELSSLLEREYADHPFDGTRWVDALTPVREAVRKDPAIGLGVWEHIEKRGEPGEREHDLWRAIAEGWTDADLEESATEAVARVGALLGVSGSERTLSRFLVQQAERHGESGETGVTSALRDLATALWDQRGGSFEHSSADPVGVAPLYLNSWPGDLTRYWLLEVGRHWREKGEAWSGLDYRERGALEDLLSGPLGALDAVRPALASDLYFIFGADPEFAVRHVLPLFTDPATSRLAWNPYLHHPRYNDRLLAAGFLEAVTAAWDQIKSLGPDRLDQQFVGLVASIVSFAGIPAAQRQLLLDRSVLASDGAYAADFASAVVRQLEDERVDGVEIWERWLREHLAARLRGLPRSPSAEELERWSDVVPHLGDAVPEALDMLNGRAIGLGDGFRCPDIDSTTLAAHGPALAAHYAERVRHSATTGFLVPYHLGKLVERFRTDLGAPAAQPIVDAAGERGIAIDEP